MTSYESGSGFRDEFAKIIGTEPSLHKNNKVLKATWIDTPLGSMLAIADDDALYLLEFGDWQGLERAIERLRKRTKLAIIPGSTPILKLIAMELQQYFQGKLKKFITPLQLIGSAFQKRVWAELEKIPPGKTRSYLDIAKNIHRSNAFRAVANANGSNLFAIVIPCHRVINNNGELGGYGGGLSRKKWLLELEKKGI